MRMPTCRWFGARGALVLALAFISATAWAQDIEGGANAAGRLNGRPGGVGGPETSNEVEVASPSDLSIIPLGELADDRVSAGAARLLDALAMEDAILSRGLILGDFDIRPAIDLGTVLTDNAAGGAVRNTAPGFLAAPEVVASSSWARHQVGLQARGSYLTDLASDFVEASAFASVGGRLDLGPGAALGVTAGYSYASTGLEDEIVPAGAPRPGTQSIDGRLRLGRQLSDWAWAVNLTGQRNFYSFEDGSGTDTTGEARLSGRVAKRVSAAVTAFADAHLIHLAKASGTVADGVAVSAEGVALYAGVRIDVVPTLVAEVALGLRREGLGAATGDRSDDRTRPALNATVIWAPIERLRVRFGANGEVKTSGLQTAFARSVQTYLLAVEGRPSDRLRLLAGAGFAPSSLIGVDRTDRTSSFNALADRDINKTVAVRVRYDHERTTSDAPGVGQVENRLTLILRLRR